MYVQKGSYDGQPLIQACMFLCTCLCMYMYACRLLTNTAQMQIYTCAHHKKTHTHIYTHDIYSKTNHNNLNNAFPMASISSETHAIFLCMHRYAYICMRVRCSSIRHKYKYHHIKHGPLKSSALPGDDHSKFPVHVLSRLYETRSALVITYWKLTLDTFQNARERQFS
jgi:hypothetical protein